MRDDEIMAQRRYGGSALILAVVLTSLLAMVGVLFVMASRVEQVATSSISENRQLDYSVESVLSRITEQLKADVPGRQGQEYYDYPDANNPWLAPLQPYDANGSYRWRQISDVTGYIDDRWGENARRDVDVKPTGLSTTNHVREYPEIELNSSGELEEQSADADGDGIADAKWIELADVTSTRGKPIYAAVRVIDNGGMVNVNTAYSFDANETQRIRVDGSSQLQIDLERMARDNTDDKIDDITIARSAVGGAGADLSNITQYLDYQQDYIWRMGDPCTASEYRSFDISDELELRHRYCINNSRTLTRLESKWEDTIDLSLVKFSTPYDGATDRGLDDWWRRIHYPNDIEHERRHLLTTYNFDRIIDPNGRKMTNLNIDPNDLDRINRDYDETDSLDKAEELYRQLAGSIDPDVRLEKRQWMKRQFAQLAVNMVDLRDRDQDVTSIELSRLDNDFSTEEYYYGIEPYPVITKVGIYLDPNDPNKYPNYFAVELFNPFDDAIYMDDFWLRLTDYNDADPNGGSWQIAEFRLDGFARIDPNEYIVISNALAPGGVLPIDPGADDVEWGELVFSDGYKTTRPDPMLGPVREPNIINANLDSHNVAVVREIEVEGGLLRSIYVDRQLIYKNWVRWDPDETTRFYERGFDVERAPWWYVVYPGMIKGDPEGAIMGDSDYPGREPPGADIDISMPRLDYNGAVYAGLKPKPYRRRPFVTVGDIARIWTVGPRDYLYDPEDANDPNEPAIFDPNSLDPNDPNDANDLSGILAHYNSYSRTMAEKLRFVSLSKVEGNPHHEVLIHLNLADPDYRNIFQYVTVFDPRSDGIDNDGDGLWDEDEPLLAGPGDELKVPGRININTAPWFVLARLPWVSEDLARAIVAHRDKINDTYTGLDYSAPNHGREDVTDIANIREAPGFESIGELATVINSDERYSIDRYGQDGIDLDEFPDLTPEGLLVETEAVDDFEERDVIFSRISNLVTVRSDVFTAYILVRIGTDGPQKRYVAVLDRSDVYRGVGEVKVLALQPVGEPR